MSEQNFSKLIVPVNTKPNQRGYCIFYSLWFEYE